MFESVYVVGGYVYIRDPRFDGSGRVAGIVCMGDLELPGVYRCRYLEYFLDDLRGVYGGKVVFERIGSWRSCAANAGRIPAPRVVIAVKSVQPSTPGSIEERTRIISIPG